MLLGNKPIHFSFKLSHICQEHLCGWTMNPHLHNLDPNSLPGQQCWSPQSWFIRDHFQNLEWWPTDQHEEEESTWSLTLQIDWKNQIRQTASNYVVWQSSEWKEKRGELALAGRDLALLICCIGSMWRSLHLKASSACSLGLIIAVLRHRCSCSRFITISNLSFQIYFWEWRLCATTNFD